MRIMKADIQDAEDILILQRLSYQSEALIYDDLSLPPLVQTLEELRDDIKKLVCLKAVGRDGAVIGSVRAGALENSCYIGRLIVHPDYQNQGIGKSLMNKIEEAFPESVRYELFTGQKSLKNLHLYAKLGYQSFKTEILNGKVTLVYLEKKNANRIKERMNG